MQIALHVALQLLTMNGNHLSFEGIHRQAVNEIDQGGIDATQSRIEMRLDQLDLHLRCRLRPVPQFALSRPQVVAEQHDPSDKERKQQGPQM